jgi:ABC-type transport system involved in cytochrome bd biosynthesis fused ATPase/permease subunit
MRLSLARAFLLGKWIIIDSDLTSLDKNTKREVLTNIQSKLRNHELVVVMKGNKADQWMAEFVDHFITISQDDQTVVTTPGQKEEQLPKGNELPL